MRSPNRGPSGRDACRLDSMSVVVSTAGSFGSDRVLVQGVVEVALLASTWSRGVRGRLHANNGIVVTFTT